MSEFDSVLPWGGVKRVALTPEGERYKYHNPEITGDNTYAFFEDGTEILWSEYEDNGFNCMVEVPKFYFCKKVVGDDKIFGVADKPTSTEKINIDEWEVHPAFFRCRDKLCDAVSGVVEKVDYRYAPAFLGWKDSNNKLRSLPHKSLTTKIAIGTARNYAKANGNGWGLLDYNLYYAMQMLYITEYGHGDSQTMIGRGYVDGNSAEINTGGTLQYGNNTFGETTGKEQISYRGMEDFWGNCRYWIDGFYYDSNRNILIGNKGFNDAGNGYISYPTGLSANVGEYIGDIHDNSDLGFVIKTSDGSATTKLYDFGRLAASRLPCAGASWGGGSDGGFAYFYCAYSASDSSSGLAGSLAF